MTFYHKAFIDGSECYQVQGYFESMSPEEAAKKNSRARKYAYVIARTTPFKATDCVGNTTFYPGGIGQMLMEYKKSIRQGARRGMQLLKQEQARLAA